MFVLQRNHGMVKHEASGPSRGLAYLAQPSRSAAAARAKPSVRVRLLTGPTPDPNLLPYLTSAREWRQFWPLITFVLQRPQVLTLPGRPPVQHIHLSLHDFVAEEVVVAAIQDGEDSQPGQEEFRLERVRLLWPCEQASHSWLVHLIDRPAGSEKKKRDTSSPSTQLRFSVPLCFLYKPSDSPCPLHNSFHCSAPAQPPSAAAET